VFRSTVHAGTVAASKQQGKISKPSGDNLCHQILPLIGMHIFADSGIEYAESNGRSEMDRGTCLVFRHVFLSRRLQSSDLTVAAFCQGNGAMSRNVSPYSNRLASRNVGPPPKKSREFLEFRSGANSFRFGMTTVTSSSLGPSSSGSIANVSF